MPYDSENAVEVEDLSVQYRAVIHTKPTLKRALRDRMSGTSSVRIVRALDGVSFKIRKGTTYGVIGRNGAGKTTLLRTIAGIVPPTEGQVTTRGRVSTLLALGVGFNRDLTGRDNVLLGGLAAGIDYDDLRNSFDEIVAFAELEEFIDFPMSRYSSGMVGRLAFAVATHVEPELLLVDEALAAGDVAFKRKCLAKMKELCDRDSTVVLVTHGLGMIESFASECLWLNGGKVMEIGAPGDVVGEYKRFMKEPGS